MENTLKLTIVVPAYNVEAWIGRCLESIMSIPLGNDEYDVIVVNDGATDNSGRIAEDYANRYANMKVISQSNMGLSAARNVGIENARGQYIWFVDSDDWIDSTPVPALINKALSSNLDVLCFGLWLCHENGTEEAFPMNTNFPSSSMPGEEFVRKISVHPTAWCALYRREYLMSQSLRFMEGIIHEDLEFTTKAYLLADRIGFVPVRVYKYFQRNGSIMNSSAYYKRAIDLIKIADSLYLFATKHPTADIKTLNWLNGRIDFIVTQALACGAWARLNMNYLKKKPYLPLRTRNGKSYINTFQKRLINFSPYIYQLCYRILKKKL